MGRWALVFGCWLALLGCSGEPTGERVLFDFELDSELDRLHWKCHTLYSLSDEHTTHGLRSLRLELYPSPHPGLTPMFEKNDWRPFKAFCFDIFNPRDKEIELHVRIDDRKAYPDYGDRYNKGVIISPGLNRIRIPFDSITTSETGRSLDLKNIYRFFIFMIRPKDRVVLYVDYLRLVS